MKFFYLNLLNFFFPKVAARNIFSALCVFFLFFSFTAESSGIKKFNTSNKKFAAPPVLTLGASDFNGFNISCNGDSDGSIDLIITGGLPPFDILWSNGDVTEDIDSLVAGNYSVRVIDANSDTVFSNINLIEPDPIEITIDSIANILCNGGNNAVIELSITGGAPPFGFLWSDGSTNEDLENVIAGNYTDTVTDLNGCLQTVSQTIAQPDSIEISFSVQDETCGNDNGNIVAVISGGTNPFSFLWSNSETTSAIDSLQFGTYTLTVTDSNLCVLTDSVSIDSLGGLTIVIDSVHNEKCFGDANGGIFISLANGSIPYNYVWSDGSSIEDLSNVILGNYTVTVADNYGCTAIKTDSI
ncbi:MAG: SprB repeat-containing protein, partial [Bacteroidota bacterium]